MPRLSSRAWQAAPLVGLVLAGLNGPAGHAGEAAPQRHLVVIERFAFDPPRLEIRAGDSVEWINRDLAPHSATSDGTLAGDAWDSGTLAKRERFEQRFMEPGTLGYLCAFHPHMRGEIVVAP